MSERPPIWRSGALSLDVGTQKVFIEGKPIKLSGLSVQVLQTLMAASPESVSNQTLMDDVWTHVAVSQETVTQRIALIRKALKEAGLEPNDYISSTRLVGYRWLKPVVMGMKDPMNRQLQKRILLGGFISMLLIYFAADEQLLEPNNVSQELQVSAQVEDDDMVNKAWQYLDKHTSQTNLLAEGMFRQALALNDQNARALTGLSIALSHQTTKFNQSHEVLKEARSLAKQAITLEPDWALAWAALAFVDDANGDIDQAIIGYEKAAELDISSLAYLYGKKGRLVNAMRMGVAVLGSEQFYLDLQIAHLMELLGQYTQADQWYRKADLLSPDNVFATSARAQFYLTQQNQTGAIELLEQAINRGIERPELHTLLGLIAWKQNQPDEAVRYFQAADDHDSQSAWMLQAFKPPNEPLSQWMQDSLSTNHGWSDEWVNQAQYLAQTDQHQAAMEHLNAAFIAGYRYSRWLEWLPAFEPLKTLPDWQALIERIDADVSNQKALLQQAEWLPTSFLQPED